MSPLSRRSTCISLSFMVRHSDASGNLGDEPIRTEYPVGSKHLWQYREIGKLFFGLASRPFCDIAGDTDCCSANLKTKTVLLFGRESICQFVREKNRIDSCFPRFELLMRLFHRIHLSLLAFHLSLSSRNRSASIAAMQPVPAAVTACRYFESCTSPAAKTPGTLVTVPSWVRR